MIKSLRLFFASLHAWANRNWVEFFALGGLLVLSSFLLWPFVVHTVPPGHVGVLWKRFAGTQTAPEDIRQSGMQLTLPWDRLYIYDARLQFVERSVQGLSVEGLDVTVEVFSRFLIVPERAGFLHEAIGENYVEKLFDPALRAIVLSFVSDHKAENLYSEDRADVETQIRNGLTATLSNVENKTDFQGMFLEVEDVRITELILPEFVREAIRSKEQIRQISESYDYRLQIEDKERERKRIEAEGIRTFQTIVAPGITESYLRWRGIEATLKLAQSPNAKIVVIGGGGDGLPIILNADPATVGTAVPSADPAATQRVDTFGAPGAEIEGDLMGQTLKDAMDGIAPETLDVDLLGSDRQLAPNPSREQPTQQN